MSGSVNKMTILGNLGADPEFRSLGPSGGEVCNLRIATSESWKDRATGERKEKTEWHTVAIFVEGLIGIAKQYLKKGSKVYIEGKMQTRKWQDNEGKDRYSTECVLNGPQAVMIMADSGNAGAGSNDGQGRSNGGGRTNGNQGGGSGSSNTMDSPFGDFSDEFPGEVPF